MKKIIYIASALLGMAALASCVNNDDTTIKESNTTVKLTAGIETRTDITDPTAPKWTEGDAMGVYFVNSGSVAVNNQRLDSELADNGATATFSGEVTLAAGEYTIYGYYPYSEADATASVNEAKIEVPAVQHPSATSFDANADVMVMWPVTVNHDGATAINYNDLYFKRALSMLKFQLNSSELGGEAIRNLTFTTDNADLKLAGKGNFNLDDASFGGFYADAVTEITAEPAGEVFANGTDAIILCVPAMTMTAGTTLTITGETDGYTFERSVTLGSDIVLATGGMHTMEIASLTVTPKQEAVQFADARIETYYGPSADSEIYWFTFDTDTEVNYGDNGGVEFQPYVFIDKATLNTDSEVKILDIPNGTYNLISSEGVPQTMVTYYSYLYMNGTWFNVEGGSVTITGDHTGYNMKFNVIHDNGTLVAEYNGPFDIENPYYDPQVQDPAYAAVLGDYVFDVIIREITMETDISENVIYNDILKNDPNSTNPLASFSNFAGIKDAAGTDRYIDLAWDGTNFASAPKQYQYLGETYNCAFVGCVIPSSGKFIGSLGIITDGFEVSYNPETGTLTFPTEFTETAEGMGTWPAHYVIWTWNASTGASSGRITKFMSNMTATKVALAEAPAITTATGETIKIKMGSLPEGVDVNSIVKTDNAWAVNQAY
jgi:hypothetical protein